MVCDKVVCECREAMSGKNPSERGGTRRRRVRHIMGLFARSNRLCINLHTQVSHANVTSIAKSSMSPKILTRKEPTQCHICHACHAKRRWMSPSATPATRNKGRCRQVPRLPRETKVDGAKRHACHAKRRWMSSSATPAT